MNSRLALSVLTALLVGASATAQSSSANLPTSLPSKLPSKLPSNARSTLASKLPAKKSSKTVVFAKKKSAKPTAQAQVSTSGLPKSLPAKKTVKIDFTQKSASSDSSVAVVIREDKLNEDSSTPRTNADVQTVRSHEVKEAPYLEVITENGYDDDGIIHDQSHDPTAVAGTASGLSSGSSSGSSRGFREALRQALPDSDSYIDVPVEARPQIAIQLPPKKSSINIVPPVAAPAAASVVTSEATTALVESANEKLEALQKSNISGNSEAPRVVSIPEVTSPEVTIPEVTSLEAPAESAAPLAPAPVSDVPLSRLRTLGPLRSEAPTTEIAIVQAPAQLERAKEEPHPSTLVTESEVALEKDKNARDANPPSAQLKTTYFIPRGEIPKRRLFVRTGYLDARYSKVQGDLKNGATLIGVSASQVFSQTEVRLGLDVAHGLDQAVTLRNTRMAIFRAEGLYHVFQNETFTGFIGGAIGVADIDVTSYRSTSSGEVVLRENAKGTALLGSPELGGRARIGRDISLDLTLQYLLLAGKDEISGLGGTLAEFALGFSF